MSKYTIVTLEEVESTNSYALEHILNFDDKTIIFTSHQSLGRGRYNRKWIGDNSSNVYMSIVLKPENTSDYPFPNLTQYLSVCVCKVLENQFGINPSIKWPNDILVEGAKISGILAETNMKNGKINAVVLGLGLNVNLKKDTIEKIDQKATSIGILKNCYIDVDVLLKNICEEFFENYEVFEKKGFALIEEDYVKRCTFLGKNIVISEANKKKNYCAKSIDDNGLLIAIDENGSECKIITGDVLC